MADELHSGERERFVQCYRRLMGFVFKEDTASKTNFNLFLDELNSLEYSQKFVKEEVGYVFILT